MCLCRFCCCCWFFFSLRYKFVSVFHMNICQHFAALHSMSKWLKLTIVNSLPVCEKFQIPCHTHIPYKQSFFFLSFVLFSRCRIFQMRVFSSWILAQFRLKKKMKNNHKSFKHRHKIHKTCLDVNGRDVLNWNKRHVKMTNKTTKQLEPGERKEKFVIREKEYAKQFWMKPL